MQGYLSYRAPNNAKISIYVSDGKSMEVEAIGHFRLLLKTEINLDLKEMFIGILCSIHLPKITMI